MEDNVFIIRKMKKNEKKTENDVLLFGNFGIK